MPLIVLTGVNGFIGTNLCEKILSSTPESLGFNSRHNPRFSDFDASTRNDVIEVIGCDLPESLARDVSRRFLGSARYTYCDYEQLIEKLNSLPQPPDIIVHNGACSSTTETDQNVFDKLNTGFSQKIWDYCTEKNVPLIYASSAAVYGNGKYGFSDRKTDCHKYTPLNLYGKSKLDFDLWVLKQKKTPPTWFGLRYFNVFGPHEGHKKGQASMVFHGYFQAVQTGKIKLFKSNSDEYKDGDQERDFVYVDDVVNITKLLIKMAMQRKRGISETVLPENGLFLNVGNGIANTWNTLAVSVFEAIGLPINIEYIPIPENIVNQYQNYTCADLSQLMSLNLDYNFSVFQDSVKRYIHSYLMRGMQ